METITNINVLERKYSLFDLTKDLIWILDGVPDLMVIVNQEDKIMFATQSFLNELNFQYKDISGAKIYQLLDGESQRDFVVGESDEGTFLSKNWEKKIHCKWKRIPHGNSVSLYKVESKILDEGE